MRRWNYCQHFFAMDRREGKINSVGSVPVFLLMLFSTSIAQIHRLLIRIFVGFLSMISYFRG